MSWIVALTIVMVPWLAYEMIWRPLADIADAVVRLCEIQYKALGNEQTATEHRVKPADGKDGLPGVDTWFYPPSTSPLRSGPGDGNIGYGTGGGI